jgi:hypothetical protein
MPGSATARQLLAVLGPATLLRQRDPFASLSAQGTALGGRCGRSFGNGFDGRRAASPHSEQLPYLANLFINPLPLKLESFQSGS